MMLKNNYQEIEGDLINLALGGKFDVIAHGCNCFCTMGSGIAFQMSKVFGCDNFFMENKKFKGDINKLGQIEYTEKHLINLEKPLYVVNAYTQYELGKNLDYTALRMCLRKLNYIFKGKHIGLPLIGCGIAGGVWDINQLDENSDFDFNNTCFKDVKTIIQEELTDCQVTIVKYNRYV